MIGYNTLINLSQKFKQAGGMVNVWMGKKTWRSPVVL